MKQFLYILFLVVAALSTANLQVQDEGENTLADVLHYIQREFPEREVVVYTARENHTEAARGMISHLGDNVVCFKSIWPGGEHDDECVVLSAIVQIRVFPGIYR